MSLVPNCFFFTAVSILAQNVTIGPPDAENQVFNGAGPYLIGNEVWDAGHVYRSLLDNNTQPLTDDTAWDDLGQVDQGALLWVPGSYAINTYKVLNGRIWKSAASGNTTTPGTTNAAWTDFGPTNRFRAFDLMFNRPAESLGEITWQFTMPQSINALVVMVPQGAFCELVMRDPEGQEVHRETQRITMDSGGGPYNHDFGPIESASRIIFHGLPPGAGSEITMRIYRNDGGPVGAGQIAMGFAYDLGVVVTGSRVSASSLRDPEISEFGIVSFGNRPIQRIAEFNLRSKSIENDRILTRVSAAINQPACVYMVDGVPYGLVAYGYAIEIDLPMNDRRRASGLIEIKGFAEQ